MAQLRIANTWNGSPLAAPDHVVLDLGLSSAGDLLVAVDAPFHGDPAPPGPPGPTPRLWEHEVVELFLLGPGPGYLEVELGPHGHHLVLQLEGVRRVARDALAIAWTPLLHAGRFTGVAQVPAALLPPRPWRANATAIHGPATARRYASAVPLPGALPDFHQPDLFAPLGL